MMDPEQMKSKVAEIIAQQLDCDEICRTRPSGCGCSQIAADAVLLFLSTVVAQEFTKPVTTSE